MADPWAQFREQTTEQPKADPWSEFKVVAPERNEIVPANSFAGLSKDEIRTKIAKLPAEQRKGALRQWADAYVTDERKGGGVGQYVGDVVRNVARGVPALGAFADEANAGTAAALHAITGGNFGSSYDEAKAYQDATDRATDKDTAKLGTVNVPMLGPVDVTGAMASKVVGSLLAAPSMPIVAAMRGTAAIPSMVNAGTTGLAYGAAHGAGEGNDLDERAKNAGYGALFGAPLAAAGAGAGRGIGNAAGYAWDRLRPTPAPVRGYEREAVNRVSQYAADDNLAAVGPRRAAELGPEGMIGDMGQNLMAATGGLARLPGEARSVTLEALNARKALAPDRITQDVNQALGPPVNVPWAMDHVRQTANAAARPHYDQFYSTPIKPTPELETALRRVPQAAWGRARELAEMEGIDLAQVANTGRGLDLIKRAVDDIAEGADRGSNLQRIARDLARTIRTETDTILNPAAPTQSSWAQARRLAGEGKQFEDAAEAGQAAFSKGLSPDQMRYDVGRLTPYAQSAYGIGARDQVRQVMGNSATQWGANADNAARRALGSENAREKLEIIAGAPAADRLTRRLDAETAFERTRDLADRNSVTSTMQAVQKTLPAPVSSTDASLATSSMSGMGMEGVRRAINALSGGAYNERQARIAADMARMLVAQGNQRDQIIGALVQRALQRGNTQAAGILLERYMTSAAIPVAGRAKSEGAAR